MLNLPALSHAPATQDDSAIIPTFHSRTVDEEIRRFAYHLYLESHGVPGHDVDNWFEAKACLQANIPEHSTRSRLHHHVNVAGDDSGRAEHSTGH